MVLGNVRLDIRVQCCCAWPKRTKIKFAL